MGTIRTEAQSCSRAVSSKVTQRSISASPSAGTRTASTPTVELPCLACMQMLVILDMCTDSHMGGDHTQDFQALATSDLKILLQSIFRAPDVLKVCGGPHHRQ